MNDSNSYLGSLMRLAVEMSHTEIRALYKIAHSFKGSIPCTVPDCRGRMRYVVIGYRGRRECDQCDTWEGEDESARASENRARRKPRKRRRKAAATSQASPAQTATETAPAGPPCPTEGCPGSLARPAWAASLRRQCQICERFEPRSNNRHTGVD